MIMVLVCHKERNIMVLDHQVLSESWTWRHLNRTSQLLDLKLGINSGKITTKKVSFSLSLLLLNKKAPCHSPSDGVRYTDKFAVERRRREVINEGIENIAKLIPGADKNKGAILQNACRYIGELHNKIKDFDNERRLFEVAQAELVSRNNSLRDNAERAWSETQKWMNRCRDAGLQFDDYDAGLETGDLDENTGASYGAMNSSNEPGDYSMGGAEKNDNPVS